MTSDRHGTDWKRLLRKTRMRPLIALAKVRRANGSIAIREPESQRVGGILASFLGSISAGSAIVVLTSTAELWTKLYVASICALFGMLMLSFGSWLLFSHRAVLWDGGGDTLFVEYGFRYWPRRLSLDRRRLEARLFPGNETRIMNLWPHVVISLREAGTLDNAEARIAWVYSYLEARSIFDALDEFLEHRAVDDTLLPVRTSDADTISVSRAPTLAAGRQTFAGALSMSSPDRVALIWRKVGRRYVYPAPPPHPVALARQTDGLRIDWSDGNTQVFAARDAAAIQLCRQEWIRTEINLVLTSPSGDRVNLLTCDDLITSRRQSVEAFRMAQELAEFLEVPLLDHRDRA